MLRGGGYIPKLKKFEAGDFVYLRQPNVANTLAPKAKQSIYRVVETQENGVIILQGRCGRLLKSNVVNCAPCHLPNIDTRIDPSLATPDAALACEICNFRDDEKHMLLCEACNAGYHMKCLTPPLKSIPKDAWLCPECVRDGITVETVKKAGELTEEETLQARKGQKPLTMEQKDSRAKRLDGRFVLMKETKKGLVLERAGKLKFIGTGDRPRYFQIEYADGGVLKSVTYAFAKNKLWPEGSVPPGWSETVESKHVNAIANEVREKVESMPALQLSGYWTFQIGDGAVRSALNQLMPGNHKESTCHRIRRLVPGGRDFAVYTRMQDPESMVTEGEVETLFRVLDLSIVMSVVDLWSSGGNIKRVFASHKGYVYENHPSNEVAAEFHLDPTQPESYSKLRKAGVTVDAVVCAPWFVLLDLLLPLAERFAGAIVCMRVPLNYVNCAVGAREQYLKQLKDEGRLLLVTGLPASNRGNHHAWLIVFKSTFVRRLLQKKAVMFMNRDAMSVDEVGAV
jgi:hypothetical protein